jgi:hypothetical protein
MEHGASPPDLKKQRPASDLLDFLAYCEGVCIPLEFVLNSLDYVLFYANKYFASDKLVKESVVLIKKYNMRKLPRKKTISVHRLVQEIVRLKPKNEGKEEPWLREIISSALSVRARKATEKTSKEFLPHIANASIWKHSEAYTQLIYDLYFFPTWISQTCLTYQIYKFSVEFAVHNYNGCRVASNFLHLKTTLIQLISR